MNGKEEKKEEYYKGKDVKGNLEKKKEYYKSEEVKGEKQLLWVPAEYSSFYFSGSIKR